MEIDTSNLTDEQISKLSEYVQSMENENKATKWWVMPKYAVFSQEVQQFGQSYVVEPQKDSYSRSRPPLKSDFESKEAAEKWLDNYLAEEDMFNQAIREIIKLINNLGSLVQKLKNHRYIFMTDINDCFESFNVSLNHGSIKEIIG